MRAYYHETIASRAGPLLVALGDVFRRLNGPRPPMSVRRSNPCHKSSSNNLGDYSARW
jgi:hypothetical protein